MNTRILNATPEKRLFLSIIPEYDLKRSICELIDNAIDLWSKNKRADLEVKIVTDEQQQFISIQDNAGGLEESKLDHVISPGKTSNDVHDEGCVFHACRSPVSRQAGQVFHMMPVG